MRMFRNFLSLSLIISVLLHVTTIIVLNSTSGNKNSLKNPEAVEIVIIDADKVPDLNAMQIVEQDEKPVNDEIDPNAQFLSQHNQKVIKQTRAENTGAFKNDAGSGVQKGATQKVVKQNNEYFAKPQDKGGSPLDKFKPQMDWTAVAQKNIGGDGADVSRSSDYLKDLDKGPQTTLTTREFLYYTYFKRIKGRIAQYWEPSIKKKIEKMVTQGRKLASTSDRKTKLLIVLNNEGNLIGVKVIGDSGVQDLDDAAVEAFKSAAPFPNPPEGIVEEDGTIKIRWDFVLEA